VFSELPVFGPQFGNRKSYKWALLSSISIMKPEGWMREGGQTRRHMLQVILLMNFAFQLHFALGEQATLPSLDEILLQLEGNLNHYDKEVPNFFCNEHVVSSLSYAKKHQSTITDSVFRVVRTSSGTLTESHEIQAVNGTPAKGEHAAVQQASAESLRVVSTRSRSDRGLA
jgi:hypothetical protein